MIATTNPRFWDADNRSSQYGVFASCSTHLAPHPAKEDNKNQLPSTLSSNAVDDNAPDNLQIPFQRSKKKSNKNNNELEISNSFDDRAKAKLKALSTAKVNAEESKLAYLQLVKSTTTTVDNENIQVLHEQWKQSEEQLSHAYSQAIKYTSRILKNQKATQTAERLLFEWMDRFTNSFESLDDGVISTKNDTKTADPNTLYMNKKRMIRTINKIVPKLTSSSNNSSSASPLLSKENNILPKIHIPPPTEKDYMNILRAYSMSKAKRKGQQCETLLTNMLELAKIAAYYYSEDDKSWTEDRVHDIGMEVIRNDQNGVASSSEKRWIGWVNESIPKSKAFSIAIKCYAGTTQTESLERILLLNHIHDEFSKCCVPHVHGIYNDDPYVLFHSIKSLKNFQIKEERKLGEKWMQKLHKFVTSYENRGYLDTTPEVIADGEENSGTHYDDTQTYNTPTTIDVTSAYTTTIRLLAKLRGTKGVAADARNILDLMHKVHHVHEHGLKVEGGDSLEPPARVASIEIRPNAYNLSSCEHEHIDSWLTQCAIYKGRCFLEQIQTSHDLDHFE